MLFTPEKVIHYTEGDCWALAVAVQEMTGLPMFAVGYTGDADQSPADRYWCHVVVQVDDRRVLDVRGLRESDEAISEYLKSHGVLWPITQDDLQWEIDDAAQSGFSHCDSWEQIREDAAILVAAHIPEAVSHADR